MKSNKSITGFYFSCFTLDETILQLCKWASSSDKIPSNFGGGPRWFACVNPHSLETARRDSDFAQAMQGADLVTADGTGIVIASRILNAGIPERVCGPDIFPMLCEKLNEEHPGIRMFFLGSNDDNLRVLEGKFKVVYPNLVCAGTYAPPYKPAFSTEDNAEIIRRVNASESDVLWIGLGAPKQEKWAHQNRDHLNVKLIGPVGGVFDFFTGRVKLPPKWVQRFGMISLYRLCQEPRRLWRRNLDSPIFLLRVIWQLIRQGRYSPEK